MHLGNRQRALVFAAELRQPSVDHGECGAECGLRLVGGDLLGALLDDADLRIDQVADPPVIADFPPPPGDFPEHPRALADRRQPLVQREPVERLDADACAASTALRIAAMLASLAAAQFGLVQAGICSGHRGLALRGKAFFLCAARLSSIRATASSTMRVSALRLRLAYSLEKPAAPRSLHEGFADRGIVLLARLRGACRDRRKGKCFVGHAKLFAQITAR